MIRSLDFATVKLSHKGMTYKSHSEAENFQSEWDATRDLQPIAVDFAKKTKMLTLRVRVFQTIRTFAEIP